MNNTGSASAPGSSLVPDTIGGFTFAHLAIIAIFALIVIAAIVWGARQKHARRAATRQIVDDNARHVATKTDAAPTRQTAKPVAAARPVPTAGPTAVPSGPPSGTEATAFREPIGDEPIAAAAPMEASRAAEAAPVAPASSGEGAAPADASVSTLKGLGPKLAGRLAELGITTVGQIAALSADDAARLDAQLGAFAGRMSRDRWIEQARFLATGDRAGFEAVFGRL